MSVIGLSPSDIVNGVRVVGKGITALKEKGGSQSTYRTAHESLHTQIRALHNVKDFADRSASSATPSSIALSDSVRLLQEHYQQINEELRKSDAALGSSASSSRRRGITKKLGWAFSGDQAFRERTTRSTAGLSAVTLDTIVLAAQGTNDSVSQLTSDVSEFRTSMAKQVQDHARDCTSHNLAANERLLAQMNSNKDVLLAQLLSSQDALCSRITDLDSHLQRWDTEPPSVQEHITDVTHVAHTTPLLSTITKKQEDARFLNNFLALIWIGFQKLLCYPPRDIYAARHLNDRLASSTVATGTIQPYSSAEIGNSACEDLVKNISVAAVSVTSCVFYRNPSTKKAFQRWIADASGDPFFATLLVITAIWLLRCLTQLPRQLSLLGGDFVIFEDALGVPLRVPFSTCEHFTVFNAFIEVHFEGKPGFRHVVRRKYHLTIGDSRGMVIEHVNWKDLVKPRSRVSMAMLMTYTTMCAKCGLSLDPQANGEVYCKSCDQLYTFSIKTATSEHEILTPGQIGQATHDGDQEAMGAILGEARKV